STSVRLWTSMMALDHPRARVAPIVLSMDAMLRRMPRQFTRALFVVLVAGLLAASSCSNRSPAGTAPAHAIVPTPASEQALGSGEFRVMPSTVIVVSPNSGTVLRIGTYLSALIGLA